MKGPYIPNRNILMTLHIFNADGLVPFVLLTVDGRHLSLADMDDLLFFHRVSH